MRIRFRFAAIFTDPTSDAEIPPPKPANDLDISTVELSEFFDPEIADEGVIGGQMRLRFVRGLPTLEVVYRHPDRPTVRLIEALQAFTVGQLEDGIGEGGFECELARKRYHLTADVELAPTVEVDEDGQKVPRASRIAIAARDGDLTLLATALESEPQSIDRLHQGCTALHLAILYGHPEAVSMLLAARADPNRVDAQDITPLEDCALSNSLTDEQSREIGRQLLDAGANPDHKAPHGESARSYAEIRGKKLLAAMLKG